MTVDCVVLLNSSCLMNSRKLLEEEYEEDHNHAEKDCIVSQI